MILPATPFRLEREMLPPLARGVSSVLAAGAAGAMRMLREPLIGVIIPDLLVGLWAEEAAVPERRRMTRIDAHVVALLERGGPLRADEVQDRLNLSAAAAEASLQRLRRGALVDQAPDGYLVLRPACIARDALIVAFEAKLTRWQEAVEQARSYLAFADRAFVVLDGNRVRITDAVLSAATTAGVGLIMQHAAILRVVVSPPGGVAPITALRALALTKLISLPGYTPDEA